MLAIAEDYLRELNPQGTLYGFGQETFAICTADCVGAFLFLASNDLSGYVTGQVLHVNGGQFMAG